LDLTKPFTTARKRQPHPPKEIKVETPSGRSKNVQTNVAKTFLNLIKKHLAPNHNLQTVFNKNNAKVSYSCMPNIGSIINNHSKKILINNNMTPQDGCDCSENDQCPLDNNFLINSVVYKANVTTDKDNSGKNYIGLTEGTSNRYTQHKLSFRNRMYANRNEPAKHIHIWKFKDNKGNYKISAPIISLASPYNTSKRCNLCQTEKFHIKEDEASNFNKRTYLTSNVAMSTNTS